VSADFAGALRRRADDPPKARWESYRHVYRVYFWHGAIVSYEYELERRLRSGRGSSGVNSVTTPLNGWRDVWDFNDLESSEQQFRALLAAEAVTANRAAILTQLARIEGLRGRFASGDRLLAEAEEIGGAESWVMIERGRLRRSSGDGATALPSFEAAYELALAKGDGFLAADAAHMAAIVGDAETWTARGTLLCSRPGDPGRYWLAPLLNNLGWSRYESGDFDGALAVFEEALAVRSEEPDQPHEREIARYAVGKALRALGRVAEATTQLERAVAWATEAGVDTPYFHEELAECYAAGGRTDAARAQAERALALFREGDAGKARLGRLLELAA
jgi:tetratricopeptide (TPR) repeat protein